MRQLLGELDNLVASSSVPFEEVFPPGQPPSSGSTAASLTAPHAPAGPFSLPAPSGINGDPRVQPDGGGSSGSSVAGGDLGVTEADAADTRESPTLPLDPSA